MSVTSDKFTEKKLECIYDKDSTQSYIYSSVKEWLKNYGNGQEAFIGHNNKYPLNKNGLEIKKVKILDGPIKEEFELKPNTNQYVAKDNVIQIRVYTRENDSKLYFEAMDRFKLINEKKRTDMNHILWFGQGKGYISIKNDDLSSNGVIKKPILVYKGQTVFISKNNGDSGYAIFNGCTSGMLEVASINGDQNDLIKYGLATPPVKARNKITVSTIQSIVPISISILGKK